MAFKIDQEEVDNKVAEEKLDRFMPQRFFLKSVGDTKEIIFVDDTAYIVYEHGPCIAGNWTNFTCPNDPASLCCEEFGTTGKFRNAGKGYGRWFVYHRTIVETTPYKDRTGREFRNELKLFSCKTGVQEILKQKVKIKGEPLRASLFAAYRTEETAEKVGSQFEHLRSVDMQALFNSVFYKGKKLSSLFAEAEASPEKMEQLKKVFAVRFDQDGKLIKEVPTFNYDEVVKPPSAKEISDIVRSARANKATATEHTSAKSYSSPNDGDAPF